MLPPITLQVAIVSTFGAGIAARCRACRNLIGQKSFGFSELTRSPASGRYFDGKANVTNASPAGVLSFPPPPAAITTYWRWSTM